MEPVARPRSVALVASGLVALAVISALGGFAATEVSACCGSPDEPDGTYALVGLLVGALLGFAAAGLALPLMPWWAILICASGVPIICMIAAPSSSDLAGFAPFGVIRWVALAWFLRRPRTVAWLRS